MQQTVLNVVRIDRWLALLGDMRRHLSAMMCTMPGQMKQNIREWRLIFLDSESLVCRETIQIARQKILVDHRVLRLHLT